MSVVSYAAAVGLTAFVVYLLIVGQSILLPFVIAVFVWYLINAFATLSDRLRVGGHPLPAMLRFSAAVVILCVMTWVVVTIIIRNIGQVMAAAPTYQENLLRLANRGGSWLGYQELND